MKRVKIKECKIGEIVIINQAGLYFEFKSYEKFIDTGVVAVHAFGKIPMYYKSEDYLLEIAENLDDLRYSKKEN